MDSIQQLRRRAENGDADALFSLGKRHDEGIHGVEQDLPIARQFYERAAELGDVDAMVNLAILLVDGGVGVDEDAVGAKALYERAVELGHVGAMNNLARLLQNGGVGVDEDAVRAKALYERAVELGDVKAMNNLAILLVDGGVGVDEDAVRAKALYERAAKAGIVPAITTLADWLITGQYGERRDLDRARQLLEKVASTSANPWAKTRLAQLLLSEDFVSDVNRGRAIELLQSAASETQFDMAHHELAILCDLSNAEERFKPPVRIRPTGTAKFHFKAAATGSKAEVDRGSTIDKVIAAGSQYGFVLKQISRAAGARSKTCLLVTLGGAGRGKT